MNIREFVDSIDEFALAVIMIAASVYFMATGKELPEWWGTGIGMVLAFYFTRKASR